MKRSTAAVYCLLSLLLGGLMGEILGYNKGFENGGVEAFTEGVRYADRTAREGDCH